MFLPTSKDTRRHQQQRAKRPKRQKLSSGASRYRFSKKAQLSNSDSDSYQTDLSDSYSDETHVLSSSSCEDLFVSTLHTPCPGDSLDADSVQNTLTDIPIPDIPISLIPDIPRCSTPVMPQYEELESLDISHITDNSSFVEDSSDSFSPSNVSSSERESDMIYEGSMVSVQNLTTCLNSIKSNNCLSDVCVKQIYTLIENILPPVGLSRGIRRAVLTERPFANCYETTKLSSGKGSVFISLDLKRQLCDVVVRNFQHLNKARDIYSNGIRFPREYSSSILDLHLIVSADGVPLFTSKNVSMWPIWIQIAELPQKLRVSFCNISLLGLWVNRTSPDWELIWNILTPQLETLRDVGTRDSRIPKQMFFTPLILVADMVAKAPLLNMLRCNGFSR